MSNNNSGQNRFLFLEENDLVWLKEKTTIVKMGQGRSTELPTVPLLDGVYYNGKLDDFEKAFNTKLTKEQQERVVNEFKRLLAELNGEKYGSCEYKTMRLVKEPIIEDAEEEKDKYRFNRILVVLFEVDDILDARVA